MRKKKQLAVPASQLTPGGINRQASGRVWGVCDGNAARHAPHGVGVLVAAQEAATYVHSALATDGSDDASLALSNAGGPDNGKTDHHGAGPGAHVTAHFVLALHWYVALMHGWVQL